MKQDNLEPEKNQIILYTTANGSVKLEVFLHDETLWLTQKMMSELFGVDIRTISEHLQNIFYSEELLENSTIRKFRIVHKEQADKKALAEYEAFNKTQSVESDFDREVKKFLKNNEK